ncbi:EmrB/QacA subfamily drug resistance transporter [Bradyrhizobium japonicum]
MSNVLHDLLAAATLTAPEGTRAPTHPSLVIVTTILASSLAFIDSSIVNVGLPAIGESFRTDAIGLQWVVNAYLLPLSAVLLLGGAAGDRYGRRRLLIAGAVLFAIASLACAVAPTLTLLLAARFTQGVSAAILMPNSLAILGDSFSGEAKGRAIGIWAAAGAAAGAVGPVLGGWLIDAGSWRLAFLINVPVAIAAIVLASHYVVKDDVEDNVGALDLLGAALASIALVLATWALTEGTSRAWSAPAFVGLGTGFTIMLLFLLVEQRLGDKAMLPLSLLASRSFVGLTFMTFLLYGALGGLLVLMPYLLIQANGYTATQAGAALLPLPLVIALASPAAGVMAAKVGPRWLLIIGPLIVAAGFLLTLRIGSGTGYWFGVFPALAAIALGMAGAVAPLTTAVLVSVDGRHMGAASGFNSTIARTGALIATSLIGPVMASSGATLRSAFDVAAMMGALICATAATSAAVLITQPRSHR